MRHSARRRRHWANPEEIHPGYWLVEEGSGPKATKRRLAIVRHDTYGWTYSGHVEVYDTFAHLKLWLPNRSWDITGPSSELCPMLTDLVRKYA